MIDTGNIMALICNGRDALIVLLVCFLIQAIFVVHGFRRGFLKIAFSLCSIFIALFISSIVSPFVSSFLEENAMIEERVRGRVEEIFHGRSNITEGDRIKVMESFNLPEAIKGLIIENDTPEVYDELFVEYFEDYVAAYLARLVMKILAFAITFAIVILALRLIFVSLDLISNLPVLKPLNRILGAASGAVEGVLSIWLIFLILTMCIGGETGRRFFIAIEDSILLSMLYNSNPLLRIMQ